MQDKKKLSVFIINLNESTERKAHMQELCGANNLEAEFIEAVDGRGLSDSEISEVYFGEKSVNEIGRELSRSEIGVSLSHKKIYKKMLNENIDMALILEDDIDFDEWFLSLLDKKVKFTDDWELILFGHHTRCSRNIDTAASLWSRKKLTNKYRLVRPCEIGYGAYGYLISISGAKKILKHLDIISKPIDHFTGDSKYVNLYVINPAPIKIYTHLSDNFHSMNERTELDKSYIALSNEQSGYLKKKIRKHLPFYQHLVDILRNTKMLFNKLKPLRKYK